MTEFFYHYHYIHKTLSFAKGNLILRFSCLIINSCETIYPNVCVHVHCSCVSSWGDE